MRKEKLLKIGLISIMTIVLLVMTTSVFAADGDYTLDLTNTVNTNPTNTNTPTTNTPVTNTPVTNTPTTNTNVNYNTTVPTNNTNTNLPNAGLAENTIMIVTFIILAIIAIYAYSRIKYYKSI